MIRDRSKTTMRLLKTAPVLTALSLFLACIIPISAAAHTRSESFSRWRLNTDNRWGPDGDTVYVSVTMKIETALGMKWVLSGNGSFDQVFLNHTISRLVLKEDGTPCPLKGDPKLIVSPKTGYIRVEWKLSCARGTDLLIENNAYFDMAPNHAHIARMAFDDDPVVEKLFTGRDRTWEVRNYAGKTAVRGRSGPVGSSLWTYWVMGADHIISGLDHLAFLLGLLLLCRRARDVIVLVTGFTLGHSVTLGLGALGIINPDAKIVQALIGFTIALVAAENIGRTTGSSTALGQLAGAAGGIMALAGAIFLIKGPSPVTMAGIALFSFSYLRLAGQMGDGGAMLRPAVTLLFGLIHGFGFAGSLMEIGLPADRFLPALLGFNLGVESGQLVIVFLLWWMAKLAARLMPALREGLEGRLVSDGVAASLCGLGMYWFVSRAYG